MERFKKDQISIEGGDSPTVKKLKIECNELINQYNVLSNPLSEQGQQLASQINFYVMKLHQLKDFHY